MYLRREPAMNERVLAVLHKIIDALGGGHQHLHDAVDAVTDPAPADGATGNDDASNDPKAGK